MIRYISGLTAVLLPTALFAADGLAGVIANIQGLVSSLIPLIIGIAVVVFIWGILQYVVATDEDKRTEARSVMIYGIIVLFVMVSVWGIVELLGQTIGVNTGGSGQVTLPSIPGR